ncbi:NifU family protein [Plantactinospora endophytica]|uniref:NifU family protein n=1 Tax=Plantactinospora endophytica TaxID=673535 RepID=A0ABQ4DZX5_9ACTN|nr:NifU family protein [Plantactinospora endophytica]GIG87971.1 hypothetical protein Pen02_29070 [Plantactinospora endophytica]
MTLTDRAATELVDRAEGLLERVASGADPALRADAVELVRALLELYGEGLARIIATAVRAGGDDLVTELAADGLVAHLLLLHGLHPVETATRVADAVRTWSRASGVPAELLDVAGDTVRLRLPAAGTGCGSSTAAGLAEAVRAAAPEIAHVDVEQSRPAPALIPVGSLRRHRHGDDQPAAPVGTDR